MSKRLLIFKNGNVVDEYRRFLNDCADGGRGIDKTSYMYELMSIISSTFKDYRFAILSLCDETNKVEKNGNVIATVKFDIRSSVSKISSFLKFVVILAHQLSRTSVALFLSDGPLLIIVSIIGLLLRNKVIPVVVNPFSEKTLFCKMVLDKCPLIFARSIFVKHQMVSFGVKSKIVVYLPCYDESFFSVNNQDEIEGLFSSKNFNIVFIGRLINQKGIYDLLSVARQLKAYGKIRFFVVGRGAEEKRLKYLTNKWRLTNVSFLGYTNRKKIYSVYRNADLTFLPSYREGLNKVIIESIISQVPILASSTGGMRDWVIPDETGYLIEPGNVQGFADKILMLYENREYLMKMKNNMLIYKAQLLDSELTLNKLFKLYYRER